MNKFVEAEINRDRLTALREENERLRAKAIIWHKWPEEKPGNVGLYLINAEGDFVSIGDYDPKYEYWVADEGMINVTHWAEIPRPEGE
jgi:hypothetical protein